MTHPLVTSALDIVSNLRGKPNVFDNAKPRIDDAGAQTSCSSFVTLLLRRVYALNPVAFVATFGARFPRAVVFANAVQKGIFHHVQDVREVKPGMLGFIAYDSERDGMSGHCFLVVGEPSATELGEYVVPVVDSCRTHHGNTDTRALAPGGIGRGQMRLIADPDGEIVGYKWSIASLSEKLMNGRGQTLYVCSLPDAWPLRAQG